MFRNSILILILIFTFDAGAGVLETAKEIQSRYQEITDLKATFTQSTYIEVLGITVKETGSFYMKRPNMFRIEYSGEHPKEYISNGKRLWIVDPSADQIEALKVTDETVPREALQFLNGFARMDELFEVREWMVKKAVKGHRYLTLAPKNPSPRYQRLDCDFGADVLIQKMVIHNKSGNISTYMFNNIAVNIGLEDSLFNIKKGAYQ